MYICLYVFGLLLGGVSFWNGCTRLDEGDFLAGMFMMSIGALAPLIPSFIFHKRVAAQTVNLWAKIKSVAR